MKKFIVDSEVFDIIPDLNIGVLVLKNVNEKKELDDKSSSEVKALLDTANSEARKYLTSEVIS